MFLNFFSFCLKYFLYALLRTISKHSISVKKIQSTYFYLVFVDLFLLFLEIIRKDDQNCIIITLVEKIVFCLLTEKMYLMFGRFKLEHRNCLY